MKKDEIICIRNGKSEILFDKLTLEIDRWGKITSEKDYQNIKKCV